MYKSEFTFFFVTPFHLRQQFWGYHSSVYLQYSKSDAGPSYKNLPEHTVSHIRKHNFSNKNIISIDQNQFV
jgi:hypothetical protein